MLSILIYACMAALAIGFLTVVWRLRRSLAGALFGVALLSFAGFVISLFYWMSYYMGDGDWPRYLNRVFFFASVVSFVATLTVTSFQWIKRRRALRAQRR